MSDTSRGSGRMYNMDLERVLLIFLVIVLHFNNRDMGGALNAMSSSPGMEIFIRITQSLAICAVDAFIISSGYFAAVKAEKASQAAGSAGAASGSAAYTIPWRKALWLLAACSFYRVVGYLLYVLWITHDFSLRVLIGYMVPNNWFVCLFVTLLLFSPFIDRGLAGLSSPGTGICSGKSPALGTLLGIMTLAFSVLPTFVSFTGDLAGVNIQGLSTVTWQGDGSGFNIAFFVYMYCMGYALRMHRDYWERFPAVFYLIMYVLAALLSAAVSRITESVWNYSSVTVVLEAMMLTLLFTRIRIGSDRIGRIISAVGGCSYGIFIWHMMPLMIIGLWSRFDIPRQYLSATLSMYALSFVWVYACRLVSRLVRDRLFVRGRQKQGVL
ncbi:MAG: acyltransferase family protein [Lachnospiraceae bacterium]|nr:acyltransferase family protein [Lachnospiraceae bacterium]